MKNKFDPIKQTLQTRVYEVAKVTELDFAGKLSKNLQTNIYLKREDTQSVHSFKLRGAYNKIANLKPEEQKRGVITASAGNHAQGVALAAQKLGLQALIVMPATTPQIKVDAVASYGAEIKLIGDNYSEAYLACMKLVKDTHMTFIHPFDDDLVIAGQATIGKEIIEQLPKATHIFVPVGGGGLIAGVAMYVKSLRPDIKIIGVEPSDSNAMQKSVEQNKIVTLDYVGIFADGVAVKQVGKIPFKLVKKYVDQIITVSTDQICSAIRDIYEDTRSIVEPAGALAVAGVNNFNLRETDNAVAICSGANIGFERLQQIAERTLIGSGKEALFAIKLPEKAGALTAFCNKVINGHSITEFNYRINRRSDANVLVGVSVNGETDTINFKNKIKNQGFDCTDLSDDEITKSHIRHMIGGQAETPKTEHFYEVDFPERPGALIEFLANVSKKWNISAFNYRSSASDTAKVMIAFESNNKQHLESAIEQTEYQWQNIDSNQGVHIFLANQ